MAKKLYYVADLDLRQNDDNDNVKETTGIVYLSCYTISDSDLTKFFEVETTTDCDYESVIQDWLEDNGYGEDDIKIIKL